MIVLSVLAAILVSPGIKALSLPELSEPASERQAIDILPTFLLAFIAQLAIILITSEDDGNVLTVA